MWQYVWPVLKLSREEEPLYVKDLQGTLNIMRGYYSMFGLGNKQVWMYQMNQAAIWVMVQNQVCYFIIR